MQLQFVKYQAAGNDFIIINNFKRHYIYDSIVTKQLCHRQFGIGADGILTIEQKVGYDFSLLHYNADGSRGGGLCGNGGRAAIHYAHQLGMVHVDQQTHFWTIDGSHTGYMRNGLVYLHLQDVDGIQQLHEGYFLDNGTRHYVEMVSDVQSVNMQVKGFARRRMVPFQKIGVNLNFVEIVNNSIIVRTCECGLETEPLSCGTGSAASALVASTYFDLTSPVEIMTKGGKFWLEFSRLPNGRFVNIYLIGDVYQSFHGTVDLNGLAPYYIAGHASS